MHGCAALILAPSLETFRVKAGVSTGQIGVLFTAAAVGYLVGSLLAGRLLAAVPGHHVIAGGLTIAAVMLLALPSTASLVAMVALQVLLGVGGGLVDVAANALVLWTHRGGAVMNALHLCFGIGATVAPVIVGRSLAWTDSLRLGYGIVAVAMLGFAVWAVTLASPTSPHEELDRHIPEGKGPLLVLGVLFFVAYVGIEIGFIGWIFDYGVANGLDRSTEATWLGTAFLAAFTFGRLLSIPLGARVSPRMVMAADLAACTLGMVVLLVGRDSVAAMWVGTIIFGLGTASMFPTMLSLAEPYLPSTGAVTSLFLGGASAGSMTVPWLIGVLIERQGTDMLPVVMLVGTAACGVSVIAFLRLAVRQTARQVRAA